MNIKLYRMLMCTVLVGVSQIYAEKWSYADYFTRVYSYSGIAHVNTGAFNYMSNAFKHSKVTYNECAGVAVLLGLPFGVWGISKIYKYGSNILSRYKKEIVKHEKQDHKVSVPVESQLNDLKKGLKLYDTFSKFPTRTRCVFFAHQSFKTNNSEKSGDDMLLDELKQQGFYKGCGLSDELIHEIEGNIGCYESIIAEINQLLEAAKT